MKVVYRRWSRIENKTHAHRRSILTSEGNLTVHPKLRDILSKKSDKLEISADIVELLVKIVLGLAR